MVRNRRNVALLFAVYFLQGLCFYSPVATLYRLEAGLTLFQTGLLESISLAAMLLLEIPWGRAADRIGHRRTLVICSALFALSKVVFWKARAFPDFLAERLILAVALAGLSGCDSAYLFACVGEKESQRIFGLWNAVQTAGLLVAGRPCGLCSATLPPRCSHFCSPTRRRMGKSRRPPRPGRGWAGCSAGASP